MTMRRASRRAARGPGPEAGSAIALGGLGLVTTVMALVLVLDVGAYLLAASRAQGAADAAALAAVTSSDPRGRTDGSPTAAARSVTTPMGARVVRCACEPGSEIVVVMVEVDVPAMFVTRYAAQRVEASASAQLAPFRDRRP